MAEDGRKNNGGHSTKGYAGRKSKSEELGLNKMMDEIKPTKEVLQKIADIIEDDETDNKTKLAASMVWINYRVGKPKERKEIKVEKGNNFPAWLAEEADEAEEIEDNEEE